jgi:hypothetical protein
MTKNQWAWVELVGGLAGLVGGGIGLAAFVFVMLTR